MKRALVAKSLTLRHLQGVLYKLKPYRAKFRGYYLDNGWSNSESASGPGSTLKATETLRYQLEAIIHDFRIQTIVDVPCGDFNWMKAVNLNGVEYLGLDIVPELVEANSVRYRSASVRFAVCDLLKEKTPRADLIICRDCLFHYPSKSILRAVRNFRESGSTFLLTTTFPELARNEEIETTGLFRPINLQQAPFNFSEPVRLVLEMEGKRKASALWRLDSL